MRISRKPSYVLLEIMIAIALVSLCALPLALSPLQTLKKEIELLEKLECERIAEVSFAEIKEELLRNEIPWKELSTSKKEKNINPLRPYTFSLRGIGYREIKRQYKIFCPNEKEGAKGKMYRHLLISLELFYPSNKKNPLYYDYHLFAQKIPDETAL